MNLQGSCRCGAVKFSLLSHTPCPFMRCYCSICRKVDGGGGYAINIMGMNDSLKISQGGKHIKTYAVVLPTSGDADDKKDPPKQEKRSSNVRSFCGECGTHLWAYDKSWEHWIYPFASAIDTDLPTPPHVIHMMLGSKASWVEPEVKEGDKSFEEYPEEGIEEWHKNNKCYIK
jgi:hypothetical protein